MAIHISWGSDDKTIVLFEYEGKWTWKECHDAFEQAYALLDTVDHEVNAVHDFTNGPSLPDNALLHAQSIISSQPENLGAIVLVNVNYTAEMMWKIFSRIHTKFIRNHPFKLFRSREDAFDWLTENSNYQGV